MADRHNVLGLSLERSLGVNGVLDRPGFILLCPVLPHWNLYVNSVSGVRYIMSIFHSDLLEI